MIINRPIIRKKFLKRRIDSEISYDAVWEQLEYLNNESNIKSLLKRAIDENYYGLDLDYLKTKRKIFIGNHKNSPKRFIKNSEIDRCTPDVLASFMQASEYFKAAKNSTMLTKPVFLYYGMVSFAKSLISSTYILDKNTRGHGLEVKDELNPTVKVRKNNGEFPIFHDCYLGDPFIYSQNDLRITLKELLSVIPGIAIEWDIAYNGIPENPDSGIIPETHTDYFRYYRTSSNQPFKKILKTNERKICVFYGDDEGIINKPENKHFIHIIDAYFMAMFILCHLARYRPLKWMKFLNDSVNPNSYLINIFLRRSELDFPILILNEMTAMKYYYSPFARLV